MRANEFLPEGLNHPIISVDVQPEYANYSGYTSQDKCEKIIHFVNKQTGPVLMFINAEDTGVSRDTKEDIVRYWEDVEGGNDWEEKLDDDPNYTGPINWDRFTIVDKGYGYLRGWMDQGVSEGIIVKTIRLMYQQKVSDSRDLEFPEDLQKVSYEESEIMHTIENTSDSISVMWTSVAQLRKFNGAYIVGGGRNECLREVELLMNAFNIKYKRIDSLVYG